jgi:hypothetical protein
MSFEIDSNRPGASMLQHPHFREATSDAMDHIARVHKYGPDIEDQTWQAYRARGIPEVVYAIEAIHRCAGRILRELANISKRTHSTKVCQAKVELGDAVDQIKNSTNIALGIVLEGLTYNSRTPDWRRVEFLGYLSDAGMTARYKLHATTGPFGFRAAGEGQRRQSWKPTKTGWPRLYIGTGPRGGYMRDRWSLVTQKDVFMR